MAVMVACAQIACVSGASAIELTHSAVRFQVPTMAPPHGSTVPHAPLPAPPPLPPPPPAVPPLPAVPPPSGFAEDPPQPIAARAITRTKRPLHMPSASPRRRKRTRKDSLSHA